MAQSRSVRQPRSSAANRAKGAATVAPEPAQQAVETLLRNGEVTVRAPDKTWYLLRKSRQKRHKPVMLFYRHNRLSGWVFVNPGWGFTGSTFDFVTIQGQSWDQLTELAALTVLNPIFAGVPVWKLRCGTTLIYPCYTKERYLS